MSLDGLSVRAALAPKDFVKISWLDKILPDYFTVFKYLSITDHSVIKTQGYESFLPVDLLKGVDLSKSKYITLLGVAVCGFWTVPEDVAGGATIGLVDTRMHRVDEGTICRFSVAASAKEFTVKFVPNYPITAADAARNPWKLFVRISKVEIKDGFSPLSLEIACLVATSNSIFKKGLRATVREHASTEESLVSVSERNDVVEPFFDNLPIARSVVEFDRSYKRPRAGPRGRARGKSGVGHKEDADESSDFVIEDAVLTSDS